MENQGTLVSSKQSLTLDLPPSCIEFCASHPSYFVVGTYNLQKDEETTAPGDNHDEPSDEEQQAATKKPQSRNGSLIVFRVVDGLMHHVQVIPQPSAILDLHFCPFEDKQNVLAVVSSTGTLAVFELDPSSSSSAPLKHLATSSLGDVAEGVLFLSVAWYPTRHDLLAITLSTGEVRLLYLDESWVIQQDGDDEVDEAVVTHSLEAWTVSFGIHRPRTWHDTSENSVDLTIYSGGDDSVLRYAPLGPASPDDTHESIAKENGRVEVPYPPVKLNGHEAGVTAILPTPIRLPDGYDVVVTGSYDDRIRVFAIQSPRQTYGARRTRMLAERNLGGGVWRLKAVRCTQEGNTRRWRITILASCMHAGARLVEVVEEQDEWIVKVLARFEEHKSMNYGSDFVPSTALQERREVREDLVCVSMSFYDKLLCIWEAPPLA